MGHSTTVGRVDDAMGEHLGTNRDPACLRRARAVCAVRRGGVRHADGTNLHCPSSCNARKPRGRGDHARRGVGNAARYATSGTLCLLAGTIAQERFRLATAYSK